MAKGTKRAPPTIGDNKRRNKKIMKENRKACLTKGAIRRLARRAGVKRLSSHISEDVRKAAKKYADALTRNALAYAEHAKRSTVTVADVMNALRSQGKMLYGY